MYYKPPSLPSFLPSFLPSSFPSFLPSSLPSFLPSFLPSSLPPSLPPFLPSFLPSFLCNFWIHWVFRWKLSKFLQTRGLKPFPFYLTDTTLKEAFQQTLMTLCFFLGSSPSCHPSSKSRRHHKLVLSTLREPVPVNWCLNFKCTPSTVIVCSLLHNLCAVVTWISKIVEKFV